MPHVVSTNGLGQVHAGSNAEVLKALGPVLAILIKLMQQKGDLASLSATTSWTGAQSAATATIKAGQAQASEATTNAWMAGAGAVLSVGCMGVGALANRGVNSDIAEEQNSIGNLNNLSKNPTMPNSNRLGNTPARPALSDSVAKLKADLINNPDQVAPEHTDPTHLDTQKAIESMDAKEYSTYRSNIGRDLAAHKHTEASLLSTKSTNAQTTNALSGALTGVANAVGNGVIAGYKNAGAKAQADQTIDQTLQGIAKDQYGSAIGAQSETRTSAIGLADQYYAAMRAYSPQQG
jgi:hypothetical protein